MAETSSLGVSIDKATVLEELQRVAALVESRTVSRSTFDKHGTISTAVVEATFGSWNEAAKGKFSREAYQKRWGSIEAAFIVAKGQSA